MEETGFIELKGLEGRGREEGEGEGVTNYCE